MTTVVRERIDAGETTGTLARPAGDERVPGVLVLGGSEGGAPSAIAVALAEHGYAALALRYLRPGERFASIPLERFDAGLRCLASHAGVDAQRLTVLGVSKGGEAALLVAARNDAAPAVVCFAGSGIVFEGPGHGRLRASSRECLATMSRVHRGQRGRRAAPR